MNLKLNQNHDLEWVAIEIDIFLTSFTFNGNWKLRNSFATYSFNWRSVFFHKKQKNAITFFPSVWKMKKSTMDFFYSFQTNVKLLLYIFRICVKLKTIRKSTLRIQAWKKHDPHFTLRLQSSVSTLGAPTFSLFSVQNILFLLL